MATAAGIAPYLWNSKGEAVTKAQLDRDRKVAEALRPGAGYKPQGVWSLLGGLAQEGVAAYRDSETDKSEKAATDAYGAQWKGLSDGYDEAELINLAGNEFGTQQQSAISNALMGRNWQQQDQTAQWAREDSRAAAAWERGAEERALDAEYKRAQIEALEGKTTGFRPLTAEEKQLYGLPADSAAQIGPDGKVDTLGSRNAGTPSATIAKEIFEADEGAQAGQNVVTSLDRALEINDKAWDGPTADLSSSAWALIGNEDAATTQKLKNLVTANALESLRATFGGNPTEGERKILLEVQGSINQPRAVRKAIFERAKAAAERRLKFNTERGDALRGGNYFDPGYSPVGTGGPADADPVAAADVLLNSGKY